MKMTKKTNPIEREVLLTISIPDGIHIPMDAFSNKKATHFDSSFVHNTMFTCMLSGDDVTKKFLATLEPILQALKSANQLRDWKLQPTQAYITKKRSFFKISCYFDTEEELKYFSFLMDHLME